MTNYDITIELLSDACPSSGKVMNTLVDIDIEFDEYGLPFVKGKTFKGLCRESAIQLMELGYKDLNGATITKIFGDTKKEGVIDWNNLRIEGYSQLVDTITTLNAILSNEGKNVVNPIRILDTITHIRTRNEINHKTGAAKKNSLIKMRVINGGTRLQTSITVNDNIKKNIIEDIINNVTRFGESRTRGFGKIKATLHNVSSDNSANVQQQKTTNNANNSGFLAYEICTEEPLIIINTEEPNERTESYIPGNKIIGLLAQSINDTKNTPQNTFKDIINDSCTLKFTNAYITDNSIRFTPVSRAFGKIKYLNSVTNHSLTKNYPNTQFHTLIDAYMNIKDDFLQIINPQKTINTHHKRPDDKSIGHAVDNDLYQLNGIAKNQVFTGYIFGSLKELNQVKQYLTEGHYRIGYGRKNAYGKIKFKYVNENNIKINQQTDNTNELLLVLNSPVVLYNDHAMPSTDISCLIKYLKEIGIMVENIEKHYINYRFIGGYNTTWQRKKPKTKVIAEGSSFLLKTKKEIYPQAFWNKFIGERSIEGFGEFSLYNKSDMKNAYNYKIMHHNNIYNSNTVSDHKIIRRAILSYLVDYIHSYVFGNEIDTTKIALINTTQLGRLELMHQNASSYSDLSDEIDSLNDKDTKCQFKNVVALNYIKDVLQIKLNDLIPDDIASWNQTDIYSIKEQVSQQLSDDFYMQYYLTALYSRIRLDKKIKQLGGTNG